MSQCFLARKSRYVFNLLVRTKFTIKTVINKNKKIIGIFKIIVLKTKFDLFTARDKAHWLNCDVSPTISQNST